VCRCPEGQAVSCSVQILPALATLWELSVLHCGRFPHYPHAEMVAQMFKRAEKWMWLPERVVLVEGCGGMAGGAMAGVVAADELKLFPRSVPLRM
jgi:hypothetical protein